MTSIAREESSGLLRGRRLLLWALIITAGAIGIALKMPFGHFIMHVMGKTVPTHQSLFQLLVASEWGWLFLAAIGTFLLYDRAGFDPAPALRRLLFSDVRATTARPKLWTPALLGGVACVGFFALHTFLGLQAPLTGQGGFSHISHADQMKLMMLYPFADVGAGLSEEVIYRFGIVSTLTGLMSFARIGGSKANNEVAFWLANAAQAAFFGFIHVQQGLVTTQAGGMLFATAISPPTWSGVVLGYVYRRWGIEAAIVAHIVGDILVPIFWTLWGSLHH